MKNKKRVVCAVSIAVAVAMSVGMIALLTGCVSFPLSSKPSVPVFEITDKNGSWESQGTIAVFDDKIQPGAEGTYEFIVKNDSEVTLRYGIAFAEYLDNINQDAQPFMEYRMSVDGVTFGEETAWHRAREFDFYGVLIESGTDQRFTLEWRWPYAVDGEYDESDTLIGVTGGKLSIACFIWAEVEQAGW